MTEIETQLPDDVATLQAMVRELTANGDRMTEMIADLQRDKTRLEEMVIAAGVTMRRRKSLERFRRIVEIREPELPPCPEGLEVVQIGEDTEELLDFDGSGFVVFEIHRPKYVFRKIEVTVTSPEQVKQVPIPGARTTGAKKTPAETVAGPDQPRVVPIKGQTRPKR